MSTSDISKLRAETGAGMLDCKKAIDEAGGDFDKAIELLRKRGIAKAAKRAGKVAAEGIVASYIHAGGKIGVLVEVNSETDFVAKNEEFIQLARDIAMQIVATAPRFTQREEVTEEDTKAAEEVFRKEVEDKPVEMQSKIIQGKIDSFLKEKILLEQDYIKDQSLTIKSLIESATQKFGENIVVSNFSRYSIK